MKDAEQPNDTLQDVIRLLTVQDLMRTGTGEDTDRVSPRGFPSTDINGRISDIDHFPRVELEMGQAFQYRFGVWLAALDILTANDATEQMSHFPAIEKW